MTSPRARALVAALALACGGCCGGGGDSEASGSVTLTNETPYFVHFLHPEENVLYVEPGGSENLEVSNGAEVTVLLAPGQEAKGLVEAYADCCSAAEGSEHLNCADVVARWSGSKLSADVTSPDCPAGDGSCPYVYSGGDDVLEGESLVGALNRGAARDDVMVLSQLSVQDGTYRVRIATELHETDHIDSAWLELWDHPTETRVVKGSAGAPQVVAESHAARVTVDARGRELGRALDADDEAYWEGRDRAHTLDGRIRDWVQLSFPRPPESRRAVLLVRGRNTQLLQDAYHEYLAGFGPGMGKLMRFMNGQPGYQARLDRYLAESGFSLDVALKVDGDWRSLDPVRPVGPAAEQTIAVPVELPARASEEVRVRLAMLPGAWVVDSARLSFDPTISVSVQRLDATAVERVPSVDGQSSADVLAAIAAKDEAAVSLVTGESLLLRFAQPAGASPPSGVERTAVLHVVGYYEERDRSQKPCVNWKRLFAASREDNSFARHVLRRVSFQDEVDRFAQQSGIRSPR